MGVEKKESNTRTAGDDPLAAVLPTGGPPWYKQGHLLRLNLTVISLVMFSSANGFDGSLMNGLQALHQWNSFMDNPTGAWLGWLNAIYWLGSGIGYPVAAWVSNKYGRKPGVWAGYIFLVLGCALQTAANNDIAFLMARFFVGIASALFGNAVPLLINEIAYPTHRGVLSALFMSGWYVGGSVAGWIIFATRTYADSWAWRLPSLLQILVPAIALPGLFFAPESPRWLISVGRNEEAHAILTRIHAAGDVNSPLVNYEYTEIATAIEAEQEAQDSASYLEMFKTPGNRHRLFISVTLGFCAQWVGNGVVSYYLAIILTSIGIGGVKEQTLISACMQMWNLIFAVVAALFVDKLGRRPLFLASTFVMLISFILVTALSGSFAATHNSQTGIAVIPFLFLFFAGYGIGMTPFLTAYPCEIWPFRLRSRGLTVTWVSSILAIFFNTFVNPIALEKIAWKYYFVFVVVLIFFGFTCFFTYPETNGYSLEQMAVVFDGADAAVVRAGAVESEKKEVRAVHEEEV